MLFAVWLVDYGVDVKRAENSGGAIIGDNNYAVGTRCDKRVINSWHRILMPIGRPNHKWNEWNSIEAFTDINNHTDHYTKNFPPRITCWPSNQMSKSRPTQSICVLETQFAPVCSA
jgi:hypothetical protein